VRAQGNRATKEYMNMKMRNAAIRAQAVAILEMVAATVEMAVATKKKANILEDQNVLTLFTVPEAGNISEEAREYL
jgi:predicted lipoprotein with Yx(FWY)xxD motif